MMRTRTDESALARRGKTGKISSMETATLSTKGQLVIPSRYRNALHLRPGDKVAFTMEGEKLVIAPAKVSATATSTVPEAHSICDSARAASTSGGIGGVHAAMIMTAKGTRTMPRVRIDIRDIVLILNSFNQF